MYIHLYTNIVSFEVSNRIFAILEYSSISEGYFIHEMGLFDNSCMHNIYKKHPV